MALKRSASFSPTTPTQMQSLRFRRNDRPSRQFARVRTRAVRVASARQNAGIRAAQERIHGGSGSLMTRPSRGRRRFGFANCKITGATSTLFYKFQAVLFDIDGTLVDSDPLHYLTFRDMLVEIGYNGGSPITKEFYSDSISGKSGLEVGKVLFPEWDQQRRNQFLKEKEARFRSLAANRLDPVAGLHRLADWIKKKGFHRAAVTNAPRDSAEQMISAVGLSDFFEYVVIGNECERAKPFPDPYLKGLEHFGVSAQNAFAFEDSPAGLSAAVAAGLPVVGITTGNPGPALIAAGAAFLIKDFNDPALWKRLEK